MSEYTKWVSVYGNAMSITEHRPESYAKNLTLRYPIFMPFNGSKLRLTFDNYCGSEPVTISKVTIAKGNCDIQKSIPLTCPADESTIKTVTFGKDFATSVTMNAKEITVSNPIDFSISAGSTLIVSIYFETFTLMQSGVAVTGPLSKGFFSIGDYTQTGGLPLNLTKTTNWFYFLSDIDLLTEENNHAIVCYGDSITSQNWPDELTLLLQKNQPCHTSVVRKAASGTRILRQYDCITYDSYGLKGSNRFNHEIPMVSGADMIIIQQGINDIIHPVGVETNVFRPMSDLPTANELIDGLKWYIEQARNMNLKVMIGTLLPFYGWRTYAPFREDLKNDINTWIRSTTDIDAFIDFENCLCDEKNKAAFAPQCDSGDHLHPSAAGYQNMAKEALSLLYNI